MKKSILLACILLVSGCASNGHAPRWGYAGHEGPENWAKLSPDNYACSGRNQSPINLTRFTDADLSPIGFNYKQGGYEILNNGHTIQVNYEKGSSIKVDGITFNLLQFHFHAPSENHINGQSYPLEAHLVHADKNGNLAVIAVMFNEGGESTGLKAVWPMMPKLAGDKYELPETVGAEDVLPKQRDYYRFNGSLTTPPCSEGVR